MKFGLCIRLDYPPTESGTEDGQKGWLRHLKAELMTASQAGFDYVELPLSPLTALPDDLFAQARSVLESSGLPCPVMNSLIRPGLKLTGPEADPKEAEAYLSHAILRAQQMGAHTLVLGAGKARNVPDGFAQETAGQQWEAFLHQCEAKAAEQEIIIAVEPLNRKECNLIKWVEEAIELAAGLYLPHIRAAADSYHMLVQREEYDILEEAVDMGLLAHVHLADRDRKLPGSPNVDKGINFQELLRVLKQSGYSGALSFECRPEDSGAWSLRQSLAYVKQIWDEQ
ncbi:sugar phosphate isomerase/epimerase family protein [Paenibacillus sp. J2TS4]|uniref:sugar phosphate isomerase/epimerase family protein n=1 Tax=Paenibacillus sp. J2TS4 TaxID=2807194 RepID=UPI001B158A21|nr:sugar phosphate isomerase/epimerase family protein [Paenibacillus sp. J2TS4]GIP31209.1 hypothetical protein J2TS4_04190 [Paenibacillus sp. J2TS4]